MKRKKTERERERKKRDTTRIYNINNNHGLFNQINNKKIMIINSKYREIIENYKNYTR